MKKICFIVFIFTFFLSSQSFAKNWLDYYYILLDKAKGQVSLRCQYYGNSMVDTQLPYLLGSRFNIVLKIIEPTKIIRFEKFLENEFKLEDLTNKEDSKINLWEVNEKEFQIIFDFKSLDEWKEIIIKINRVNGSIFTRGIAGSWEIGECKQGNLYKPKRKF